jgi:hypothetical protein
MTLSELVKNKAQIINLKKATLKHCDGVDIPFETYEAKGIKYDRLDTETSLKRMIIANTYNWMDSHDDVHLSGIFTKSINESLSKVMHLHDHIHQLDAMVGDVIDITESKLNWTDLGINKEGKTTSLMLTSNIQKDYNPMIFLQYKNGKINQHSVGMQYVKIAMAVNDKQYPEEFAVWNKYIDLIANKDKAISKGYFFAVQEAKLIEISAVIAGSNELTPTIEPKTETFEPSVKETQNEEVEAKELDLQYILKHFKIK